jgi:hypothetical protein
LRFAIVRIRAIGNRQSKIGNPDELFPHPLFPFNASKPGIFNVRLV